MPSLTTPDGAPVEPTTPEKRAEIDREFSRAMAAEDPSANGSPPRHDAKPAEPGRRPRGRPRKDPDEKPRVTDKPAEPVPAKVDKDYTDEAAGLATLGWATLAAIPPASPWAAVIEANQDDLVKAINGGCQNDPKVRAAVERWSSGAGGVWMLQLAAVGVNMTMQSVQLLQDPALRAEAKAHTQSKFREFLKANGVKLADVTAEPVAEGPAQQPEAPDVPAAA